VRNGHSLFVVSPFAGGQYAVPRPPTGLAVREVRRRRFAGFIPLTVFEFRRR
jgi:hypothetical protein